MSIETEVKAVEQKVEEVTKTVEIKVEDAVVAVENEAKKVVAEVKTEAKAATVKLTADEKLALRDLEVVFLKAQQQASAIENQMKELRSNFQAKVDEYTKRYVLDKAEYVFDGVALEFKRITSDIKKVL